MEATAPPRTLRINGADVACVEQGAGDGFVFVHGAAGDYRSWLESSVPFAERFRTVLYSRRGHYPNAWPADYAACDPEIHAADLAALIESLDAGPVHLFGHSIGGVAALVLAFRRPDLVRTLILGEPPMFGWLGDTEEGRSVFARFSADALAPANAAFAQGDVEAGVRAFIDGVIGEGAFDEIPPPVRDAVMDNAAELRVQVATPPETLFSSLSRADVARIQAPTLLLVGAFTPPIFRLVTDDLARSLPNAEVASIPDASHDLYNPPVFHDAVARFVAQHG